MKNKLILLLKGFSIGCLQAVGNILLISMGIYVVSYIMYMSEHYVNDWLLANGVLVEQADTGAKIVSILSGTAIFYILYKSVTTAIEYGRKS